MDDLDENCLGVTLDEEALLARISIVSSPLRGSCIAIGFQRRSIQAKYQDVTEEDLDNACKAWLKKNYPITSQVRLYAFPTLSP